MRRRRKFCVVSLESLGDLSYFVNDPRESHLIRFGNPARQRIDQGGESQRVSRRIAGPGTDRSSQNPCEPSDDATAHVL